MYIWNVNKLVEEFKGGHVSERQQLYYFLVFMVFSYISTDPYLNSLLAYDSFNNLDKLMLPIGLAIGVLGTIYCYYITPNVEKSVGFLPRFICIGLPVLVRIVVFLVLIMFSTFIVNDFIITIPGVDGFLEAEETTLIDFVGINVFEVLYFWYLSRMIKASYI
ncbi:MAG: hypothetical protein AAF419_00620 [Pseudomonadota bacterium]